MLLQKRNLSPGSGQDTAGDMLGISSNLFLRKHGLSLQHLGTSPPFPQAVAHIASVGGSEKTNGFQLDLSFRGSS